MVHQVRNITAMIVVTNQCPICLSLFVDKKSAIGQMRRMYFSLSCPVDRSATSTKLVEVESWECVICGEESESLQSLQKHMCTHTQMCNQNI